MKVCIIQHAEAVSETIDPERPLSERGLLQIRKTAEFIKTLPDYPTLIIHSGKKRAAQTAGILLQSLEGARIEVRNYLNPSDKIDRIIADLNEINENVAIVGHMPFVSRLVSTLLNFREDIPVIDITNASPVILAKMGSRYVVDTYLKNEYL
jgi:phosphohistidine phosphatase